MLKRILGWLLFVWMVLCLIGLAKEIRSQNGTEFYVSLAIGLFIFALAGIGLSMGLAKGSTSGEGKPTDPNNSDR